jgi:hypothetical protein
MTDRPGGGGELSIHLDLAGLAALLKAVEAAMVDGHGQLVLRSGSGAIVSGGSCSLLGKVTVTFDDSPGSPDDDREDEPEPLPSTPVLEMQR